MTKPLTKAEEAIMQQLWHLEKGNVSDVQAIAIKGTKLAEVATNAIRKGPRWIPAQQNGKYVNKLPVIAGNIALAGLIPVLYFK